MGKNIHDSEGHRWAVIPPALSPYLFDFLWIAPLSACQRLS